MLHTIPRTQQRGSLANSPVKRLRKRQILAGHHASFFLSSIVTRIPCLSCQRELLGFLLLSPPFLAFHSPSFVCPPSSFSLSLSLSCHARMVSGSVFDPLIERSSGSSVCLSNSQQQLHTGNCSHSPSSGILAGVLTCGEKARIALCVHVLPLSSSPPREQREGERGDRRHAALAPERHSDP